MEQHSPVLTNRRTFLRGLTLGALSVGGAHLLAGCSKKEETRKQPKVTPRPIEEVLEMTRNLVRSSDTQLSIPKEYSPRAPLVKEGFTLISDLGKKIDALDPDNQLSLSERQSKIDSLCSEFWTTASRYPFLKVGTGPFTRAEYEKYLVFTLPQVALEYGLYTHNTLRSFGTKFPLTNVALVPSFYELGTPRFGEAQRHGTTISRAVVAVERFFGENISASENATRLDAIGGGGANAAYGHIFTYPTILEEKRQGMLTNARAAFGFIDRKDITALEIINELAQETNEGIRLGLAYRVAHAFALLSGMEPLNSPSAFQNYIVKGHEDFHIRGRPANVDTALITLTKKLSHPHQIINIALMIEERSAQIGEFCSGKYGAFGVSDFILGAWENRRTDDGTTKAVHLGNDDWIVSNTISIVLQNPQKYGVTVNPDSPVPATTQVLVQIPVIAQSPEKLALLEPELYARTEQELLDAASKM
jgi:hypothetical protein